MDQGVVEAVWVSLLNGKGLDDLGLPTIDGRVDLRGLIAPEPKILREFMTAAGGVKELGNLVVIRGARWIGIDFADARLASLRFLDCSFEECSFDRALCRDWRMWGTKIERTTFRSADLRDAALGGIHEGRRNAFHGVDFSKADLRGTAHESADFADCMFSKTKVNKVDFQGSVFVNCTFEGELREVAFHKTAFRGEQYPPNTMENVDFSNARLWTVEFRGLDLANVKWPHDDEHIIVGQWPAALDRILSFLRARTDNAAVGLAAYFSVYRKWVGPNQQTGIINKRELVENAGEDLAAELLKLLRPS